MPARPPRFSGVTDSVSHVERACAGIRLRIIDGIHRPGAAFSEPTLERFLFTSRSPVGEALARLAEDRYVDRVRGRGYSVSRITVQLICETFPIGRLLEAATAARAMEAHPDRSRTVLTTALPGGDIQEIEIEQAP